MPNYIVTSPTGEKYRITAPEGASESDVMAYAQQKTGANKPMATLGEIRQQYPQYNDLSDSDLADKLYAKFYSDMPRAEFDQRLAQQRPRPPQRIDVPEGFVLDQGLPPGFVLDKKRIDVPGMGIVEFPGHMSDDQIVAAIKANMPQSPMADVVKSAPRALLGGLANTLSAGGQAAQIEMGQPVDVPDKEQTTQELERNVTGPLYRPQTAAGRIATGGIEQLTTPTTYLGPGSAALKLVGGLLSGGGSEAGGEAAKGTKYELPARIVGGLAGGVAAARALAPATVKAAIPTAEELSQASTGGYKAARESGLELSPAGVAEFATQAEQKLAGPDHGFSPKTAPKTFAVLDELQAPPSGATVTASNIDTIRKNLGNIAQETQPAQGGFAKPTTDAAAASILSERLRGYMADVPENHVMAGDPEKYVRLIRNANEDYAALQRLKNVDARLTKAENATDRQVSGSLDSQIKSKVGGMLDNPERLRGLNDAELAQLRLVNSGNLVSNTMRQLGRGGAGVIPLGAQVAFAAGSGGTSLPYQIPLAAALYGARKGSEAITVSRANTLADMLAMRSAEYRRRQEALPPVNRAPSQTALLRALLAGATQ